MEEFSQEDISSLVNSMFHVSGFTKTEFSLEFKIEDLDFREKFEELARKLEDMNYVCKLEKIENEKFVLIQKFTRKKRRFLNSKWLPRILFAVVIGSVMYDGYHITERWNTILDIGEPINMAIVYTISLMGIIGIHELGHMIAAKIHRLKTTWPYFIPGIPTITLFPTFGALILSKGLTINRRILFDVAIAGPIAGLVIAIIVALYGAYTAPVLDPDFAKQMYEEGSLADFSLGEPLFLKGALAMFGKGDTTGNEVIVTPVLWAAWFGFFLTFLNLMPAWQLDGGHMARTVLGRKWHKYMTYLSFIILAAIGFVFPALIFYFLSRNNLSAEPLDDVSPITKNRKLAYIGIIGLAVLCIPIPENLCVPIIRTMCLF